MTMFYKDDLVKMKQHSMGERGEVIRVSPTHEWVDVRWSLGDGKSFNTWTKRMRPDQLEMYGVAGRNGDTPRSADAQADTA